MPFSKHYQRKQLQLKSEQFINYDFCDDNSSPCSYVYTHTNTHICIHTYMCVKKKFKKKKKKFLNKFTFLTKIKIKNGSGLNEKITLHPSSIHSHFFCVYSSFFLSKRSEEVLLIFFRVFGNFKNV